LVNHRKYTADEVLVAGTPGKGILFVSILEKAATHVPRGIVDKLARSDEP
jgi:hypothetical protein